MQAIDLFSESIIQAVGWTVIHSLWQGCLLLVVLLILQQQLRRRAATYRYWLAYGFLMLQLGVSLGTFAYLYEPPVIDPSIQVLALSQLPAGLEAAPEIAAETNNGSFFMALLENNLDLIAACWLLGMCIFLLRMFFGLVYLRQLRSSSLPLGEEWMTTLSHLAQRLNIRRKMQIGASAKISSPLIIGQLRPLILLPIGMINQLSPAQVEAILAHELAHLRRYDYWFNLLQSFVEAIFYYHPAIWWISQQIRTEREHCCDDIAVQLCGDDLMYAKTLYTLESIRRPTTQPRLAMAFGEGQKSSLLDRINRIITSNYQQPNTMEKFTITGLVLGAALLFTLTVGWTEANPQPLIDQEIYVTVDTLPPGKTRVRTTHKGQRIETEIQDGAIKKLVIDGEKIPASEFPKYESLVEDVIESMPPPPPPPPAPAAPNAPSPPAAPNAPTPPTPPTAPDVERKVIIKKKDGGKEVIYIRPGLEDVYWIDGDEAFDHNTFIFSDEMMANDFAFFSDSMKVAFAKVRETLDSLPQILEYSFSTLEDLEGQHFDFKFQIDSLNQVFDSEEFKLQMEKAKEQMNNFDFDFNVQQFSDDMENRIIRIEVDGEEADGKARVYSGGKRIKLVEKLKADGLIDDTENLDISFTHKELKVNGKKMSDKVYQQYRQWYEEQTGTKMSDSFNINININNN